MRNLNTNVSDDEIPEKISERFVERFKVEWYGGYNSFLLAHQAEQVWFLLYPSSKRLSIDWVSVTKSRTHLIDVPHHDDVSQENVDIHKGSTIDVTIKNVGPLVHESRSSEELDIVVETYFKKYKMMKLKYNGILMKIPIKTPMKRQASILTLYPIMIPMRIPNIDPQTRMDQDLSTQLHIPTCSNFPDSSSVPTTQPSSSTAPSTSLAAWKPPPDYIYLRVLPLISQLSCRSSSPALTAVDLRSR
ncbi:hypothetical protein M9H77_04389 [Catharanthus roseus]|uniref:Uncharacterized protein n=1 Tax=Catharanthus roseus TaxID=4058 RepID=A0ACC0CE18_CATRO|nr:hypothetical protein M9H77_04389 [Catharanthus roseus]